MLIPKDNMAIKFYLEQCIPDKYKYLLDSISNNLGIIEENIPTMYGIIIQKIKMYEKKYVQQLKELIINKKAHGGFYSILREEPFCIYHFNKDEIPIFTFVLNDNDLNKVFKEKQEKNNERNRTNNC